jgi:FkbM family methyltransferase
VSHLNDFTKVSVVGSAVGAACQSEVAFFESDVEAYSSLDAEHVGTHPCGFRRRTIDCVTLDAYCAAHRLMPTFIKIDTEGFEWEVLQGGSGLLQEFRPGLLVEVSTSPDKQHAMWDCLATAGYRCYAINRSLRTRYPRQPFAAISTATEFVRRETDVAENGSYESDADFVFLPPQDDTLN